MARLHKFLPGDGIAVLYPRVGANRHLGTVTEVTATSIDGLMRPRQFFFSRKRYWFSEAGHPVSIDFGPSENSAQSPSGFISRSTASLRDCHSAFI